MIVLVLKYLYNILEYAGMGCNRLCIAGNGLQQPWAENAENAENGWKGFKIAWNCLKWMEMNRSSWKWLESPWNCLKSLFEIVVCNSIIDAWTHDLSTQDHCGIRHMPKFYVLIDSTQISSRDLPFDLTSAISSQTAITIIMSAFPSSLEHTCRRGKHPK